MMKNYEITVVVSLSDQMDISPLTVLTNVVLDALTSSDIETVSVHAWEQGAPPPPGTLASRTFRLS